uniref:Hypothetical chloroplast RF47 n=1 Tax=Stichococcus bacillaris TaxID=37433 RepID=A0A097KKJ8_9CHLO|nr:hypothetical chloroplast RF47 [Stichococcus bacillaris]AIT93709.1 hypothetical chloroplast RF47 [Stichococcus bacillaris]
MMYWLKLLVDVIQCVFGTCIIMLIIPQIVKEHNFWIEFVFETRIISYYGDAKKFVDSTTMYSVIAFVVFCIFRSLLQ